MSENVARICSNGHLITISLERFPDAASYCSKCGAKGVDHCPNCNAAIPGQSSYLWHYEIPLFCHNCGEPYPWAHKITDVAETPQVKWVKWTSPFYWFLVIRGKSSRTFVWLRSRHWTIIEILTAALVLIGLATLFIMWLLYWL